MGFFGIFKKSRREVNRENQSQGREGEEQARREYEFSGHEVERTGKGHDLKVTKRDWLTGEKGKPKYVEVKTGNSKLSKLQKKKKRQYGSRYVEKRYERTPLGLVPKNNFVEPRRRSSSRIDSMFGLGGSSKPSRRKSSEYDSMFGSGGRSSKRKSSSSGFDSMFGSGSSGSKRRKASGGIW